MSAGYLPLIVDVGAADVPALDELPAEVVSVAARMRAAELAVFHPSSLRFRVSDAQRRAGQWKGNDRLIEGFAAFVHGRSTDAVLVMPEILSAADLPLAREIVAQLGIEDHVLWALPPRPEGFTRPEMLALYDACDVVADEFAAGWFGYVALEGLAVGRPVITHLDAGGMAQLYPDGHPFVTCGEPARSRPAWSTSSTAIGGARWATRARRGSPSTTHRDAARARYVAEVSRALRPR